MWTARVSGLLRATVRGQVPRANLGAKPAKHQVTSGEQVIVLATFFVTILGPSGWILAHMKDYKKRD